MADQEELTAILRTFDHAERAKVAAFLRKATGRKLALATTPQERVLATDDWLNSHGLPPVTPEPPVMAAPVGSTVRLPAPTALPGITLEQALRERRSHYQYSAEPLPLTTLADLLHHAVRVCAGAKQGAETPLPLSAAPSAGGHNPVGVHLAARNVNGLDAGLYAYDRSAHALAMTGTGDPSGSLAAIYGQAEFVSRVPVTLLLTVTLSDPIARYGLRHYRTLHIDTGVVAQNLYLVATALGLRGCAVAGYRDAAARQLLGCADGEIATMLFPVGAPPPGSPDRRQTGSRCARAR